MTDSVQQMFGHRLRELRRGQGMTQAALAERAELSAKYLGSVENGHENPTLEVISKLSRALELRPWQLLAFEHFEPRTLGEIKKEMRAVVADAGEEPEARRMLRVLRALLE